MSDVRTFKEQEFAFKETFRSNSKLSSNYILHKKEKKIVASIERSNYELRAVIRSPAEAGRERVCRIVRQAALGERDRIRHTARRFLEYY